MIKKGLKFLGCTSLGLAIGLVSCLTLSIQADDAFAAKRTNKAKKTNKKTGIARFCSSATKLPNGLFIYKNNAPLRRGNHGPIIGFRREPTLIMNRNVSSRYGTTIYSSNGTRLGSCPWASAHGHSGGRMRCTMQISALRRAAISSTKTKKKAGSPAIYFTLNTKAKTCALVPDAGRCYGAKVRDLCATTIK